MQIYCSINLNLKRKSVTFTYVSFADLWSRYVLFFCHYTANVNKASSHTSFQLMEMKQGCSFILSSMQKKTIWTCWVKARIPLLTSFHSRENISKHPEESSDLLLQYNPLLFCPSICSASSIQTVIFSQTCSLIRCSQSAEAQIKVFSIFCAS